MLFEKMEGQAYPKINVFKGRLEAKKPGEYILIGDNSNYLESSVIAEAKKDQQLLKSKEKIFLQAF